MRRYSLAEKNIIYDFWKKHGCSYREVAEAFGLQSDNSVAGIIKYMEEEHRRIREKAGTVRFEERIGDKTFLIIRPGWCWPENVRAQYEHTGRGAEKEMPLREMSGIIIKDPKAV